LRISSDQTIANNCATLLGPNAAQLRPGKIADGFACTRYSRWSDSKHTRAARLEASGEPQKPIQKKGLFAEVWCNTDADVAGYDRFVAKLEEFCKKRQWADWE
jgi:hypothetical protein